MKGKPMSLSMILKIACTYIGAVIGAGFASGQEVFQFFVKHGPHGVFGLILAGSLFILGGVVILRLARQIGVSSYYEAFYKALGQRAGLVIDLLYILFTIGSISVMLAGSGSIFHEALGVRYAVGVLITLAVVMVTVSRGVRGVLLLNTLLIPFLVVIMLYTSLSPLNASTMGPYGDGGGAVGMPWYMNGLIYVALNLFLSMALMMRIGADVEDRRVLSWGGIVGGGVLMLVLLVMGVALYRFADQIYYAEMPMLTIADYSGPVLHFLYTVGLWVAMITTAVANAYGFIQRVMPLFRLSYYNAAMLTVVVVLPLTRFGFANLVAYMYPIFGVISLGVLVWMAAKGGWRA